MATILEFTGQQVDPGSVKDAGQSDSETAQIIFFPGIRIERYEIDPFLEDDIEAVQQDAASSSKG